MQNILIKNELRHLIVSQIIDMRSLCKILNTLNPTNYPNLKLIENEIFSQRIHRFLTNLRKEISSSFQEHTSMLFKILKKSLEKNSKFIVNEVHSLEQDFNCILQTREELSFSLGEKVYSYDVNDQIELDSQIHEFLGQFFWKEKTLRIFWPSDASSHLRADNLKFERVNLESGTRGEYDSREVDRRQSGEGTAGVQVSTTPEIGGFGGPGPKSGKGGLGGTADEKEGGAIFGGIVRAPGSNKVGSAGEGFNAEEYNSLIKRLTKINENLNPNSSKSTKKDKKHSSGSAKLDLSSSLKPRHKSIQTKNMMPSSTGNILGMRSAGQEMGISIFKNNNNHQDSPLRKYEGGVWRPASDEEDVEGDDEDVEHQAQLFGYNVDQLNSGKGRNLGANIFRNSGRLSGEGEAGIGGSSTKAINKRRKRRAKQGNSLFGS